MDLYQKMKYTLYGKKYMQHTYLEVSPEHTVIVQDRLLTLLRFIHQLFTVHNIRYSVAYGTLLGMIRNHAIIEWDDDVDIVVYEKDWKKAYTVLSHINLKKIKIDRLHYKWSQVSLANEIAVHVDIVSSDYENDIWNNTNYLFEKPLQLDYIHDVWCSRPHSELANLHLIREYGAHWRTPISHFDNMKYINFYGILIAVCVIVICVIVFLCIRRNVYTYMLTVCLLVCLSFILVYLYIANRNNSTSISHLPTFRQIYLKLFKYTKSDTS